MKNTGTPFKNVIFGGPRGVVPPNYVTIIVC